MKKRILVVEDEDTIREFVLINLRRAGYEVEEAATGEDALRRFEEGERYDIVLLDINLPGIDGLSVCKTLRARSPYLGIMMLTARTQEMDRIGGLMTGADDYVTKPFSPGELLARVDALYRRVQLSGREVQECEIYLSGPFALDSRSRQLKKNDVPVDITQVEYLIFLYFLENPGAPLSRAQIYNHVWGQDNAGDLKIVDVNMRRLRMKVEDDPSNPFYIQTVWGQGYKWNAGVTVRRVEAPEGGEG